jgi:hypothetical protein
VWLIDLQEAIFLLSIKKTKLSKEVVMSGFIFIMIVVLAFCIFAYVQSNKKISSAMVCTKCGSSNMKSGLRGSGAIELILWLFFIVPGLIYSAWRGQKKVHTCLSCGSNEVIPLNSPFGRKLASN